MEDHILGFQKGLLIAKDAVEVNEANILKVVKLDNFAQYFFIKASFSAI